TYGFQGVCGMGDTCLQVSIGDGIGITGFTFEVQGNAVAISCRYVAVHRVVTGIGCAIGKPASKRWIRPIQYLGKRCIPMHLVAGPGSPVFKLAIFSLGV